MASEAMQPLEMPPLEHGSDTSSQTQQQMLAANAVDDTIFSLLAYETAQ